MGRIIYIILVISFSLVAICQGQDCTQFKCTDNSTCLSYDKVCDGTKDCPDGIDEKCCPPSFKCSNGTVIPNSKVCNGVDDCGDGTDEDASKPDSPCYHFYCGNQFWIPNFWRCDGWFDCYVPNSQCPTVSDEINCGGCNADANLVSCEGDYKQCYCDGWKCNGVKNCLNGYDESKEICPPPVNETRGVEDKIRNVLLARRQKQMRDIGAPMIQQPVE